MTRSQVVTVTVTGAASSTFPPDPPYFGEALNDGYGQWLNGGAPSISSVSVSIFMDSRKSGNSYSIMKQQTADNPGVNGLVILELAVPLDITLFERLNFTHFDQGYNAPFFIRLEDVNANSSKVLNWASVPAWMDYSFLCSNFYPSAGFDPKQVKRIMVSCDPADQTYPKKHYLDWMYFKAIVATYYLFIYSRPSGKSGTINGQAIVTPVTTLRVSMGTYNIVMEESKFLNWQDLPVTDPGYSNPARSVVVTSVSVTVTAVYSDGGDGGVPCPFHAAYLPFHNHPDLLTMRRFRDRCLPRYLSGRYYRWSPCFTPFIIYRERLKQMIRGMSQPLIKIIRLLRL